MRIGRGVFQQGHARSLCEGNGVVASNFGGLVGYMFPRGMTHSDHILHYDQTMRQDKFYRLDHAASPGQILVTNAPLVNSIVINALFHSNSHINQMPPQIVHILLFSGGLAAQRSGLFGSQK